MSGYNGQVPDTVIRANDWRGSAACRTDADAMFDNSPAGIEYAKSVCHRCPVTERCLQIALDNREPVGTWGGLSEAERRAVLRRRGIRLAADADEDEPRKRTFRSLYDERTVSLTDGHLAWKGAVPVHCQGGYHTPAQISFRLDRGRPAEGIVRRTCGREGCVLAAHLRDQRERDAAQVSAKAAVS